MNFWEAIGIGYLLTRRRTPPVQIVVVQAPPQIVKAADPPPAKRPAKRPEFPGWGTKEQAEYYRRYGIINSDVNPASPPWPDL